jgi:DNA-directed RNA polymerase specialized sigma24 family protein
MTATDEPVGALFSTHAARRTPHPSSPTYRRYGPAELAEDLVSDAFVVALRRETDLPADADEAYAWLVGTIRKIAANPRRRDASYDKYWQEAVRTYWSAGRTDSPETVVADRDEGRRHRCRGSHSSRTGRLRRGHGAPTSQN